MGDKQGPGNKGQLAVRVCYKLTEWGDVVEDFKHPDICWESNGAGCKKSQRGLECVEGAFLAWVFGRAVLKEPFWDVVVSNPEELIQERQMGGALGCSGHASWESV